jgi:hypothetical protein
MFDDANFFFSTVFTGAVQRSKLRFHHKPPQAQKDFIDFLSFWVIIGFSRLDQDAEYKIDVQNVRINFDIL